MTPDVTLTLTPEEAVAVVNLLGNLPTHSNVAALWLKLRAQVEPQLAPAAPVGDEAA
jgi:hypothetical protein